MTYNFQANGLPVLIGSLPMDDHHDASALVFKHTGEIPLWVQLPIHKEEGMVPQFLPGMPGLKTEGEKAFVDTTSPNYENELLRFYEEYIDVVDGKIDINDTRFVLTRDTAEGFFVFLERLRRLSQPPVAVKAQITGPLTFGLGLTEQNGKAVFYDERSRDAAVKLIAQKAAWQVRTLSGFGCPVILFFDEPALAGLGSSAYIGISRDDVAACFEEVIDAVHSQGGLAGVHVCANTDWSIILESSADIVSFDAYAYFDRFILYPDQIKAFIESGRVLAWGLVPTLNAEDIEKATTDSLVADWKDKARQMEALGLEPSKILALSLITPSCGTGSISLDHAKKVLTLTCEVSDRLRKYLK